MVKGVSDPMAHPETVSEKGPIRVLIAEDEKNIGELIEDLLAREDRIITVVSNGREAISALERATYDLLITDLMMPEIDGMEVLKRAKRYHPGIMAIIMTGYASLETAIRAVKEGAYDYLRKPFRLDELRISVDNACETIQLMRENRRLLAQLRDIVQRNGQQEETTLPQARAETAHIPFFSVERLPPSYFQAGTLQAGAALSEIERLAALRDKNLLTDEEFRTLKNKLFKSIS